MPVWRHNRGRRAGLRCRPCRLASEGFGVTAGFLPVPVGRRDEMAGTAADRVLVNRYALKTPLGRGGMGVVWRAHDVVLGREVAVKEVVFPASLSAAERHSAQARVAREARAAARLNHPGVVTLYDVVTSQGNVFLVMELVEAPTLAELVRVEGPLAPERVAEIGAQVSGGGPDSRPMEALALTADLLAQNKVVIKVQTFPFDRAAEAYRISQSGHVRGKLVLIP
jgi:D-arabinose 1-dehydrogenase-like Zn-dependent alcohol dehydrogenase